MPQNGIAALVCGLVIGVIWAALLFLINDPGINIRNVDTVTGLVSLAFVNGSLFYLLVGQWQTYRWLRALVGATLALASAVGTVFVIKWTYYPDLFHLIPWTLAVHLSTFFASVFAGCVITDKLFGYGKPLANMGKSVVFCALLTPVLYLLLQNWFWGRNIVEIFADDRFMIAIFCTAIGLDALASTLSGWQLTTAFKIKRPWDGLMIRVLPSIAAGFLFFFEELGLTSLFGNRLPISLDTILAVGEPVFLATLVASWIVWLLVKTPTAPTPRAPKAPARPGQQNIRKNRRRRAR